MKRITTLFVAAGLMTAHCSAGNTTTGSTAQPQRVLGVADMQPVTINPGEAVLATFLEESLYKPSEWTIKDGSDIGLTMQKEYRMFHGAMFQWLRPPVTGPAFCMERDFDVDMTTLLSAPQYRTTRN